MDVVNVAPVPVVTGCADTIWYDMVRLWCGCDAVAMRLLVGVVDVVDVADVVRENKDATPSPLACCSEISIVYVQWLATPPECDSRRN